LSYHKEQQQYQTNAREEQKDSHATIKLSCCCLQDATMTILHNMMISSASTPRLSTVSTPKTACKYAKQDAHIAKGKYGEYAKEAKFVKEGNDEPLATRAWQRILCKVTISRNRATYTVQGNAKPLTAIGDWATTFNDPEGTIALTIKSIALIVIPYHCNEVP
jgi:hypothetical protein